MFTLINVNSTCLEEPTNSFLHAVKPLNGEPHNCRTDDWSTHLPSRHPKVSRDLKESLPKGAREPWPAGVPAKRSQGAVAGGSPCQKEPGSRGRRESLPKGAREPWPAGVPAKRSQGAVAGGLSTAPELVLDAVDP